MLRLQPLTQRAAAKRALSSLTRASVAQPKAKTASTATSAGHFRRYSILSDRVAPEINAGQPLYETRPHMVLPGQLTPGISALEYYERRLRLAQKMKKGSVAIIPGHQLKYASGAVFYPFQQNTDMFYLTGWDEPNSVAIIESLDVAGNAAADLTETTVLHMIVPPKDSHAEQWEGFRTGVQGATEIFNADKASSIKDIRKYVTELVLRHDTVYFDSSANGADAASSLFGSFFAVKEDPQVETIADIIRSKGPSIKVKPLGPLVRELRAVKSDAEIAVIRRAGQISGRAYNRAYAERFRNERTLASFLEHQFVSGGCAGHAYVPVVAGGPNALSIHYTRNDDVFYDRELVLVDAGGRLGGYRADISRTWPVNGRFTGPQRDLYQAVLNVNKKCIALCTASAALSLHDVHLASVKFLHDELRQLPGLAELKHWDVTKLYPHYVGHNLGLDVHDVPGYLRSAVLRRNQVVTIEPGVYFPADDYAFPSYYRGIGIRIEDNVAVGEDTNTNLTVEAAKEIVDIENIAANGVTTKYEEDVVDILGSN